MHKGPRSPSPPGQGHHKGPQRLPSELHLEGSQPAKLGKSLNTPPCMAALIGSWAPGLNWQLWYPL